MDPHIWYPFSQAKTALEPLKVKAAKGIWLELEDGRRIIDCISSWWVNLYGHAHPKIAQAIFQQAQQLEHVIFAGFTHEPAEQLAERLTALLPSNLSRVFFSDDGSTAVEVALKMAYQYWINLGQKRSAFIAFEGSYHGDTFGAMSVGSRSPFSQAFTDLLFEVEFLPFPATHLQDQEVSLRESLVINQLENCLSQNPDRYAAIIIEPLVQGAGGMRLCRPEFIQQLRHISQAFNVLLIFDEVMTGFGRTGSVFASDRAGVAPDIICLSKGITGGFLPLAVTVCSEMIYNAFYSDDIYKALYHGHSYTANPLGCAAALASLELLEEFKPAFEGLEAKHLSHFPALQSLPQVEKLRVMGTIAALDLITPDTPGYFNQIAPRIRQAALEQGLLLRPLGNVLYLMPPYCITEAELAHVYRGIIQLIETMLHN
ncbi:adenosylmethionine--8-amino-7-oxononanoate transaminase [Trichothermofontia sichuanensis B231]|uniref:adenosylmethionine--8-amino-7-oxononanoate transaminase n=1 Tax=Trichothermofontia sichuanensis TaxID=3045816 RepID=UPI0022468825|nr:adenosylmethionine--8-amino-7-oxononanoate transaminase [Trichothermofontia sichuanensis]UZQ53737.1 adenosylmethionine--8-amino-7-oxononanoate transaminase [Trichothermofontia sichuanensis B231]